MKWNPFSNIYKGFKWVFTGLRDRKPIPMLVFLIFTIPILALVDVTAYTFILGSAHSWQYYIFQCYFELGIFIMAYFIGRKHGLKLSRMLVSNPDSKPKNEVKPKLIEKREFNQ